MDTLERAFSGETITLPPYAVARARGNVSA
jgi:hypothetical protein